MSGDFSQQEPRSLAHMSGDEHFQSAYKEGKDIYAWCASMVYHVDYEECKEFRPDGSVNPEGKKRRSSMKSVILGLMYGRGASAIAEQLNISMQEAKGIIDAFNDAFPKVKEYTDFLQHQAATEGYVQTAYGRKRRLPDMMLPDYEFKVSDPTKLASFDPLDFAGNNSGNGEIPEDRKQYFTQKMNKAWGFSQKAKIKDEAAAEGIQIIDNGGKKADASRQCLNSVIQGSAADITKRAMIDIYNDDELNALQFKMLIPVHDEIIGECPKENAKRCAERLEEVMINCCKDVIKTPMACDTEICERWYGPSIHLD